MNELGLEQVRDRKVTFNMKPSKGNSYMFVGDTLVTIDSTGLTDNEVLAYMNRLLDNCKPVAGKPNQVMINNHLVSLNSE